MSIAQDLIGKAERRQIQFGIVGLGYVGLPLALTLGEAGFKGTGLDIDQRGKFVTGGTGSAWPWSSGAGCRRRDRALRKRVWCCDCRWRSRV